MYEYYLIVLSTQIQDINALLKSSLSKLFKNENFHFYNIEKCQVIHDFL